MKILFGQVGGTIDKDYPNQDVKHGYEFEIGDPGFEAILKRANPAFEYVTKSVLKKDSTDMDDDDRQVVKKFVEEASESKIILTHGTATIGETASCLSDIRGKAIVLTGSMLPEKFYNSDADFNLGMAVAVALVQDEGVFIVLGGGVKRVS